ncbi:hypothetical protein PPYR_14993 [Photinus pyralis]|nr:hypothetical protein PPYR_14993 [Photinus pyralis]
MEDMDEGIYIVKKQEFLTELKKEIPIDIQRLTIGQSNNPLWKVMRLKRLTASNFGKVAKLRPTTSTANIVKALLYQGDWGNTATQYGNENEQRAIQDFELITGLKVSPCGLFIDENNSFLAASPDGLVSDEALLEVKCPYNARFSTPEEATKNGTIKCLTLSNGDLHLKENHDYMYQIQGQMQICQKKICYFVVWTPQQTFDQEIVKDDTFWAKMVPKLTAFYELALLPELIDSRKSRGHDIRSTALGNISDFSSDFTK